MNADACNISVIIPTYKPTGYLDECLNSLAIQVYKQFEVIIILNGCNQPYHNMIIELKAKYKNLNINLIQTDQGGVSHARNIGIENAKGDYIAFIDDDDYVTPNYLSKLYAHANEECIVVSNMHVYYNSSSKESDEWPACLAFMHLSKEPFRSFYQSRKVLNGPWMKLFPKSCLQSIRFNENLTLGEDALFCFTTTRNIKYLKFTDSDAVYVYRLRDVTSWTTKSNYELFKNWYLGMAAYLKVYTKNLGKYEFKYFINRMLTCTYTLNMQIGRNILKVFHK